MLFEVGISGQYDLLLLPSINGFKGMTELEAGSLANFNKNNGLSLLHDDVDLAKAVVIIAREQSQTLFFEVFFSHGFKYCPGRFP